MEKPMKQAQAAAVANDEEQTATSFSNKPIVLADNGHGTKVKLWNNKLEDGREFPTISIERSYKPKGSEEYKTDKVSLTADDLLAVARGLEKGHDEIVSKNLAPKGQGRS
jgi:hypothetical protein